MCAGWGTEQLRESPCPHKGVAALSIIWTWVLVPALSTGESSCLFSRLFFLTWGGVGGELGEWGGTAPALWVWGEHPGGLLAPFADGRQGILSGHWDNLHRPRAECFVLNAYAGRWSWSARLWVRWGDRPGGQEVGQLLCGPCLYVESLQLKTPWAGSFVWRGRMFVLSISPDPVFQSAVLLDCFSLKRRRKSDLLQYLSSTKNVWGKLPLCFREL